jgi:hypothetical protein
MKVAVHDMDLERLHSSKVFGASNSFLNLMQVGCFARVTTSVPPGAPLFALLTSSSAGARSLSDAPANSGKPCANRNGAVHLVLFSR